MSKYCGKCGIPMPPAAQFCANCGQIRPDLPIARVEDDRRWVPLPPTPPPPPRVPLGKRPGWNYAGLAIGFPLCAGFAALAGASLVFHLIAGGLPAGLGADHIAELGFAALAFGGSLFRAWRNIKAAEPDSVPKFRQRHRNTLLAGAILTLLMFCGLSSYAVVLGRAAVLQKKTEALIDLRNQIDSGSSDWVGDVLWLLDGPTETYYYQEHLAVEKIIDQHEPEIVKRGRLVARFAEEAKGMPAFQSDVEFRKKGVEMDTKWIDLMRKEIRSFVVLADTPPEYREQYYRDNTLPIVQSRLELQQQAAQLFKELQNSQVNNQESAY